MKKLILFLLLFPLVLFGQQYGANQLKKDNWTIRGNASNALQVDTSHIATQWKIDSIITYMVVGASNLSSVLSVGNLTGQQLMTSDNAKSSLALIDTYSALGWTSGMVNGTFFLDNTQMQTQWMNGANGGEYYIDATHNMIDHNIKIDIQTPKLNLLTTPSWSAFSDTSHYNVLFRNKTTGEIKRGTITGSIGATGPTGANGSNGATGPTGATGATGTFNSSDTLSLSNRINLKLNITNPTATGRLTTDSAIVGNQGTEGGSIKVNGLNYTSAFKVSDINTNNVQVILHKHSTTIEPIVMGARSYSNTTSHTDMPNNENVISIYGSGWAGSSYKTFGNISIASAPSGTISNTSAPGQIILSTTPSGSIWSLPALTLNSDQSLSFGNASTTRTNLGTISSTDTRLTDWTMEFTIDGQGSVISTGIDGTKNVNTNVSITGWKLFEISGTPVSSTVDISLWKDTYANFPPTSVDTVNYWQRPKLTAQTKNTVTFATPITATKGDEIRLNANTVTGALKLKLVLIGTKQP